MFHREMKHLVKKRQRKRVHWVYWFWAEVHLLHSKECLPQTGFKIVWCKYLLQKNYKLLFFTSGNFDTLNSCKLEFWSNKLPTSTEDLQILVKKYFSYSRNFSCSKQFLSVKLATVAISKVKLCSAGSFSSIIPGNHFL